MVEVVVTALPLLIFAFIGFAISPILAYDSEHLTGTGVAFARGHGVAGGDADVLEGSVVINQPAYSSQRPLVWGAIAVVLCLAGFIGLLLVNIARRQRTQTQLRQSEARYRSLIDDRCRSEQRLRNFDTVLARLSCCEALAQGDVSGFVCRLTEVVSHTISVGRVSVWLFNDTHSALHCVDRYSRREALHSRSADLKHYIY